MSVNGEGVAFWSYDLSASSDAGRGGCIIKSAALPPQFQRDGTLLWFPHGAVRTVRAIPLGQSTDYKKNISLMRITSTVDQTTF